MNNVTKENDKLIALIVDDEQANRAVLSKLLKRINYEIHEATNGEEAVEVFKNISPDLVLMDVMMPKMNGHDATKRIKALSKNDFVPVIFLTALSGPEELKKCIDAGGDDFLTKPFDFVTLSAKIVSLERTRKLYQNLSQLNEKLASDEAFTKKIFNDAIFGKNEAIDAISTWFETDRHFNNDLFLSSYTPTNGLNILFGHFSLEGTAAAVGALPTTEVFRSMTLKGYSLHEIVDALNNKLNGLLLDNISFDAIFMHVNYEVNLLSVVNFGMDNSYLFSASQQKVEPIGLKHDFNLGKQKNLKSENLLTNIAINKNDKVLLTKNNLFSDCDDPSLAKEIFLSSIKTCPSKEKHIEYLKPIILEQFKNKPSRNHVSLIEIPCIPQLIKVATFDDQNDTKKHSDLESIFDSEDGVNLEFSISNSQLRSIEPVPTILNFIGSISTIDEQQDILFTIITEMYTNALDHGVLGLDSKLKSSPEGFYSYFLEKENRLKILKKGKIDISINYVNQKQLNLLRITMTDSGVGFDYEKLVNNVTKAKNNYSGRGYLLLRKLCDKVIYHAPGNSVTSIFSWEQTSSIE